MRKICIIICTLFVTVRVSAQSSYQPAYFTDADRLAKISKTFTVIDELFKAQAKLAHYPGLVYGIVVDGKLVYTGSYGTVDIKTKIPADSKSVFRIASMTKSFTTMAIMKLWEQGKLHLDDPAYKYVPEMANLKYLTTDARAITVRNLMSHGAGFPEDNPWGDRQLGDSEADLNKLIEGGLSFSNAPGIAYEYSNLGFALLGRVITNVSKMPFEKYITDNILKPLGMTHTYWEYTDVPASQLAHGYRWINENWREEELLHDGSHSSMGGLMTTIEDFSKYVAFHQSAWPPSNDKDDGPVKRSSLREMQLPKMISGLNTNYRYPGGRLCAMMSAYCYGLSWSKDCQDRVYIAHSGGLPGFGSNWRILPDYGIGIISFANLTYGGTGNVNLQVLDTVIALAGLKPRVLPASAILKQRQSELVKLLPDWKGAEKTGIFAENFFVDAILDSLKKNSRSIFDKAGKIIQVKEIVPENQLRGTFMLNGEKADVNIYFTLTPENPPLIQQFRITLLERTSVRSPQ